MRPGLGGSVSVIRFRPDIEGLRAVAVLMVILNHLDVPGFHGGFTGVDVFFVISGYLITSLLVAEYADKAAKNHNLGSISITHFYLRRARRILPAALMVIACVLVASNLLLNSLRVAQVKQDAVWTALFASNINFIRQATDYFAADFLKTSPYQHYWSLAVEEQYYLVWPVLFLLVTTLLHGVTILGRPVRWRARLGVTLTTIGIVSFGWSIYATTESPASAYFSAFTRAWELRARWRSGAARVNHTHMTPRRAGAASVAGLGLLVAGCVVIDSSSAFPGYLAVLPTLGAALLIAGGFGQTMPVTNRLLGTAPMRFVGRISYSLYLWHWPLIVFAAALFPTAITQIDTRVAIFVLTFVVSIASFYFIERPFRSMSVNVESDRLRRVFGRRRPSSRPMARERAVAVGALVCAVGLGVVVATGAQLPSDRLKGSSNTGTVSSALLPPPAPAAASSTGQRPSGSRSTAGGTASSKPQAQGRRERSDYAGSSERGRRTSGRASASERCPRALQPLQSHLDAVAAPCQNYRLDVVDHADACTWGNPSARHVAAITGDSHASMWLATIQAALDPNTWSLHPFARSWCGWTDGQLNEREQGLSCAPAADTCGAETAPPRGALPLAGFRHVRLGHGLRSSTVHAGRETGRRAGTNAVRRELRCVPAGSTDISGCLSVVPSEHYDGVAAQRAVAEDLKATFVDTTPWFCFEAYRCPPVIAGSPVFIDGNHLSAELAPKLAPLLRAALQAR